MWHRKIKMKQTINIYIVLSHALFPLIRNTEKKEKKELGKMKLTSKCFSRVSSSAFAYGFFLILFQFFSFAQTFSFPSAFATLIIQLATKRKNILKMYKTNRLKNSRRKLNVYKCAKWIGYHVDNLHYCICHYWWYQRQTRKDNGISFSIIFTKTSFR